MMADAKQCGGSIHKPDLRHKSVELLAELRLSRRINRPVCDQKFIAARLDMAFPAPSQHQQCKLAAAFLGVTPETVRRWICGQASPKLSDFMPVLMRCIEINGESATIEELRKILWGRA